MNNRSAASTHSSNIGPPKVKIVGTSLDASNTIGKSAEVAQAVHERISAMKESLDKALREMCEREAMKETEKADEDEVPNRPEPKITSTTYTYN